LAGASRRQQNPFQELYLKRLTCDNCTEGQVITEEGLVAKIARALGSRARSGNGAKLRLGIGDDAAILAPSANRDWVLSCDAFLEGVHFLTQTGPPDSVGYKSLVRATSDLAAMGAVPRFFLLTLALSPRHTGKWFDQFLAGMRRASRELGVQIAGGDTTSNPQISISITVIGEVARGNAVKRSGARPGDLIYVTGRLGRAALGLELIQRRLGGSKELRKAIEPHFYPRIRLKLGAWLAQNGIASSMMDISDGLSTDLSRLCAASGVGARIYSERIPRVDISGLRSRKLEKLLIDPLQLAMHGGDDYGLLFTVPHKFGTRLRRVPDFAEITQIGEVTAERQISLVDSQGRARRLKPHGWDPFQQKSSKKSG
jgi:thiamine-monophosphate kinase